MPWLILSYTIISGSPSSFRDVDVHGLRSLARTASFLAVAAGGVAAAVASLTHADPVTVAASLPVVAASLLPAAAVAHYLSRETGMPQLPGVAAGGFLVLAAYVLTVAATASVAGSELDAAGVVYAATAEEAVKLAAVAGFLYVADRMEPLEAAAVGASVGLGFAGVENLVYVLDSGEPGLMALERSAIAPLHVLTAAAAGAGLVALRPNPGGYSGFDGFSERLGRAAAPVACALAALAVAGLLHAVYNLGVLGFVHPGLGDGVGYVVFATSFYVAAFATVDVLRHRTASDGFVAKDVVAVEAADAGDSSRERSFQSES